MLSCGGDNIKACKHGHQILLIFLGIERKCQKSPHIDIDIMFNVYSIIHDP